MLNLKMDYIINHQHGDTKTNNVWFYSSKLKLRGTWDMHRRLVIALMHTHSLMLCLMGVDIFSVATLQ